MIDPDRIKTSKELSQQLRALFKEGRWSHRRLAEAAGLSPATVHAIVSGATELPRTGTLVAFVTACGQRKEPWVAARRRVADVTATNPTREQLRRQLDQLRVRAERAEAELEAVLRDRIELCPGGPPVSGGGRP
ncbi:hypothetical protein Skr01_15420 [Sphaerisporangium krabiense]|uniref:Transcriptional regulator with XRE-family HTH domain n=1 Tax=Sphaerisporangium krabiense TaxID=763782 RepID=A0A7W8YZG3_9ACTN|nr:helix-turn-helix transcriptional regulator [Sphaerisporangium krabiense]MBB5624590.1 transcriptional regulator with XRE-family HTH domain [Sphaerisporangium krabiense]GII61457.1 hypothetical protein Skr01_15420 [Sphaerisporangium krabiense]